MKRVTIDDIARLAGLTKGTVSHALNDRPGVSEDTRKRVKSIAVELGWSPNSVARALSGARAGAIGWAIQRSAKSNTIDPYFMEFFAGIELELSGTPTALVVKLVDDLESEIALYRRWAAERRVDGVIVVDVRVSDQRIELLNELGLPAAAFTSSPGVYPGLARTWFDEGEPVRSILDLLADNGHRSVGWIAGSPQMYATGARIRSVRHWQRSHELAVQVAYTDYGSAQGARAALEMLDGPEPPTAFVFDNDLMTVAGLGALQRAGLRVPEDISIVSWIDSQLCAQVNPSITALHHDIVDFGAMTARRLLDVVDGLEARDVQATEPRLIVRGSVAEVQHRKH